MNSAFTTASLFRKVLPFLRWWPEVGRETTRGDLLAGFTGAILALPQSIAFALLAGLPPEYGLYTAMVPPVLSALFGSSFHMVTGPTNAVAILLLLSLSPIAAPGSAEYLGLVLTITFLTGLFQFVMGLARLGTLVNFISNTVIVGFSAGAAILIAATQVKGFFGLSMPADASFVETLRQFALQLGRINPYVTAVGVFTLVGGVAAKQYFPQVPYMISATVLGTLFAWLLDLYFGATVTGIKTVGSLPSSLPPLSHPDLSLDSIRKTLPVAVANTILALVLAVGVGRSLGMKSGQRIDTNQEFIGQGLSNIVGSFFSCYPSAGSFNRSASNYEAGAKTPMAAVYSCAFLVVIVLLVAPLAAYLPIASMAAILFLVAYALIDVRRIWFIVATSRSEAAVMLVTFSAALFANLEIAIFAGVILSLLLFLNQARAPVYAM
jgi:sulfate permease, SulP family